jgi:hypothetical protein
MTPRGSGARRRDVARDAYRARGLSTRLGRDRVCRSRLERLTCCHCFFWVPYGGPFLTNVQGAIFYPPVGYPGYFDTRQPALVSMTASRAKLRPPTREGGAGHRRWCGRRHKPRGAIVEEAGTSFPGGLEETGAASMWKRRERVI